MLLLSSSTGRRSGRVSRLIGDMNAEGPHPPVKAMAEG